MRSIKASIQRLSLALGVVLAATGSNVSAQTPAVSASPPPVFGMVEQPCPPGSFGRTDIEQAFAREVVADGPMNPQVLKAYMQDVAERTKGDEERRVRDWPDLCRYREANAQALKDGGAKVVFLGNSITELWQAAEPTLFTGGVVDRGVSGQTSGQGLLRFYPDVVALHPKVVHILVGTNDVAGNNGPNRPEDFKNNIRAMVDMARANHIQVILGSITPTAKFPWRLEVKPVPLILELNAWMASYAQAQGLIYVDYYTSLAGPDGGMRPGISRDGVHPKKAGYALMTPLAKAAIAKALARAPN